MASDFEKALSIGRPPNIQKLFPNSKALIVSGKVIDRAMIEKGKAMTIAANGRNHFVIQGALSAAQRANAAIILEIAKSEGGANAYCAVNFWNLARIVDQLCNQMGITVPVAIHADHYGIKGPKDIERAKVEIPSMFDAGITSIAIDASHLPDDENLLASIELNPLVPRWAGYETEVGEIKGKEGLSTKEEALFLIQGLNAHDIFPDWIALNNGTTHGIEASDAGIQVGLTKEIHEAISPYKVSGAQHGTSGNSSERLRKIAQETNTTKANVATALQMITWGVKVNEYGNAILNEEGEFVKEPDKGVTQELWEEMVAYAKEKGLKGGNYKKLNLPFENKLLGQPPEVRERMAKGVEEFVHELLTNVFNAADTAPLAIEAILKAGSYDLGPKVGRIEEPGEWT
ncbi:MAG TPA: ketose-bisphosphate aldolase, partial [Desulfobacterales bacterium]|nr:ketose-bisphosphate aldolase [Desulfobacterales bacterium]